MWLRVYPVLNGCVYRDQCRVRVSLCTGHGTRITFRLIFTRELPHTSSYPKRIESLFITSVIEWNIVHRMKYLQLIREFQQWRWNNQNYNTHFNHRSRSCPAVIVGAFICGHFVQFCNTRTLLIKWIGCNGPWHTHISWKPSLRGAELNKRYL